MRNFIYAGNKEKEAYLVAFKDAQTILSNPGASQQDVKDALTALKNAKKNFMVKTKSCKTSIRKTTLFVSLKSV